MQRKVFKSFISRTQSETADAIGFETKSSVEKFPKTIGCVQSKPEVPDFSVWQAKSPSSEALRSRVNPGKPSIASRLLGRRKWREKMEKGPIVKLYGPIPSRFFTEN